MTPSLWLHEGKDVQYLISAAVQPRSFQRPAAQAADVLPQRGM